MTITKTETVTEGGLEYILETYDNGATVKKLNTPAPEQIEAEVTEPDPEPTTDEVLAAILLNQADIQAAQESQDEVLAEILLNTVSSTQEG